jgi:hypothetical protein
MLSIPAPIALVSRFIGRDARFHAPAPQVTRLLAVHVPGGATREMPRADGRMTVHCRSGSAWITYDGDPRDVVLQANQSHCVDRGERMTVHAMHGDCGIELQVDAS